MAEKRKEKKSVAPCTGVVWISNSATKAMVIATINGSKQTKHLRRNCSVNSSNVWKDNEGREYTKE